jgi:hypothetical protein
VVDAFTLVDGRLLKEELEQKIPLVIQRGETPVAVARFSVPTAGDVTLNLAGVGVKEFWIDGKAPVETQSPTGNFSTTVSLTAGEHTLTVKLDPKQLPATLRAEAAGVRFLAD